MHSGSALSKEMSYEAANNQIKRSPEDILAELKHSLDRNNVVGIFIRDSHELITTAVQRMEVGDDGEVIVVLFECDLHGYPLERTRLRLSNIERVIHFSISYDDPQYVKVRRKEKFKV